MSTLHLGDVNGGNNEKKWRLFKLTRSLVQILTGLKPKLTYDTGRNPHEDFSEDEVNSKYPNIPQDPQGYKKMETQEDLQWSPPTRSQEGTGH
jgi:hypothetical protein